jgi:hypothetical protein
MSTHRPMTGRRALSSLVTMTRDFPADGVRAADADRDRALAELSEHFQAGRLTREEFDERSGRALAARTGNELRDLFPDLPSRELLDLGRDAERGPASGSAPPACSRHRSPVAGLIIICAIAAIVAGNIAVNTGNGHVHVSLWPVVPVVILVLALRRTSRRLPGVPSATG